MSRNAGYYTVLLISVCIMWLVGCAGIPAPQEVAAESIGTVSQVSNVVTNEMEPWVLGVIILLAGWAIPTPLAAIKAFIKSTLEIFSLFK